MTEQEKTNLLYDLIIRKDKITTEMLNAIGLNFRDINKFIDLGIIRRIKKGYYDFNVNADLVDFAFKYMSTEYELMINFFKKIHLKVSSINRVTYHLYVDSIKRRDYESMIRYFNDLYQYDNGYRIKDFRLFLLLMRELTTLPYYYEVEALTMSLKDVILTEEEMKLRYKDKTKQCEFTNEVRKAVFYGKYEEVIRLLHYDEGYRFGKNILRYTLETFCRNIIYKNDKQIEQYIQFEDYDRLIKFLETLKEKNGLSKREQIILILAEGLKKLKSGKSCATTSTKIPETLFEAIQMRNFTYAINHFKTNDPFIESLLKRFQELQPETKKDEYLNQLIIAFQSKDLDQINIIVEQMHPNIKKEELKIIGCMYILDLCLNNTTFTDTIRVVLAIKNNNLNSLLIPVLKHLKDSIEKENILDALIYLVIIKNLEILIDLKFNLSTEETYIRNNITKLGFTKDTSFEEIILEIIYKIKEGNIDSKLITNEPCSHIKSIIKELENNIGIYVFETLDEKEIVQLRKELEESNRVELIYDKEATFILKSQEDKKSYIDYTILNSKGKFSFIYGDYKTAIECFLLLMHRLKNPNPYIYWYLAKSYKAIGDNKKASLYFKILDLLNKVKESEIDSDISYTIKRLKIIKK